MAKTAQSLRMETTLDDKYTLEKGHIFVSGTQALVRLPLEIRKWDVARGLNTAGFISGYRGSPLARYDQHLWNAKKHLKEHHITFTPGINEDLGATAVWGSQQSKLQGKNTHDGVFGIWYGKGPGVDRSMDVLRHANAAGVDEHGGVLALMGDDHGCVSSTLGHQSDHSMEAAMIPVLHPASIQEYLDWGIKAISMSRYSGAWVGFKCVTEIVESSASVSIDPSRFTINTPTDFTPPVGGLHMRLGDDRLQQEWRLYEKLKAAQAFARVNALDYCTLNPANASFGIMTTGKSYKDVQQALFELGLSDKDCENLGIRLYKVGLVWPLEPENLKRFARGLQEILVIEEKRSLLEWQAKDILYNLKDHPVISGKENIEGLSQLPAAGELSPSQIAQVIVQKIPALSESKTIKDRLRYLQTKEEQAKAHAAKVARLPYYCAGCPHNTSTKVPEGSRATAGIGCHFMVLWMDRNSKTFTHMGGEGATWIGESPFTDEKHIFANLGDGTYEHSGILAIRAAVAAKVNITYKILYNDAVAMTGGQPVEGSPTVPQIAWQVHSEGVKRVVVVKDDAEPHYNVKKDFPPHTHFYHRDDLEKVQKELREVEGTTVIIYDQTCAAEKRRRRKRGTFPDPDKRIYINDRVCEGCGDCSVKSNCVAVEPLETEFGRKRQINQSSCNKDFSCIKGFCPSFITVEGARLQKSSTGKKGHSVFSEMPEPKIASLERPYNIMITGIGGTGVVTIGALLGMAAHLEGKGTTVLDQTGLAQKNGAVNSHLKIAQSPEDIHAVRIDTATCDLLLGCDLIVSGLPNLMATYCDTRTKGILNTTLVPTAGFTMNTQINFHEKEILDDVKSAFAKGALDTVDATLLATKLLGDAIATNMFMLGYALQKGWLPVSLEALEKAIELNAVAVDANLMALNWGRLMAYKPEAVFEAIAPSIRTIGSEQKSTALDDKVNRRTVDLVNYQNARYADIYVGLVNRVQEKETALFPGQTRLTTLVAENAYKLMAYKDEYEVARLYTDGAFLAKMKSEFADWKQLKFHLAPPLLAKRDKVTGELQKRAYGPWVLTAFKLLARMKGLRGTAFDVFGYTAERKMERAFIRDYFSDIDLVLSRLDANTYDIALELAQLPQELRGFGHVKERNAVLVRKKRTQLLEALNNPTSPQENVKIKLVNH